MLQLRLRQPEVTQRYEMVTHCCYFWLYNTDHRPIRLIQCCTQFRSLGVKVLCVFHLHDNIAFTFKWYGNTWNKTFYSQRIWIGYNIELTELVYWLKIASILLLAKKCANASLGENCVERFTKLPHWWRKLCEVKTKQLKRLKGGVSSHKILLYVFFVSLFWT